MARSMKVPSFLILLLSLAAGTIENVQAEEYLNRSLYVPVEFKLCEHLENALLYRDEDSEFMGQIPSRRIFQFTYYPTLQRVEPALIQLRVEGNRRDGSLFIGRMAVGPGGIYVGTKAISLDIEKQMKRLKHKLDVRYKTTALKLRCMDSCERESKNHVASNELKK